MLRDLGGRGLGHDRGELLQLGDEVLGGWVRWQLPIELGEGVRGLETGFSVECTGSVPQSVFGRDQAMADQTADCEPVARGKSEILPPVRAPHGRVVLDPACKEFVGPASLRSSEHRERKVVRIDVLDMIERLAERRLGSAGNADLFGNQSEHVRAVRRMARLRPEHVSHLVGDQAIEQSRFDRSHRDVHGVTILEGFGRAHDGDGDDFGGYRPLQGVAQLGVPRLDGLERGLHLPSATLTGPVNDGDEHGGRTRGRQKNICASSRNEGEANASPCFRRRMSLSRPQPLEEGPERSANYHPYYQGKIEVVPRVPVRSFNDFAIWYTPGVAQPCLDIKADPQLVWSLTNKWNQVAVVTDGTRVLGLGDIGPEAGLPVMEGKALLFKYLGGVDAYPICLGTKAPEEIENAVRWLQPSFGGINLEDISQPKCFEILDVLRRDLGIPVWHDDQQGTGTVVCAGLMNALKIVGKKMKDSTICMLGAGAANIAVARIIIEAGVDPGNIIMVDSKGILSKDRTDLSDGFRAKLDMALKTNREGRNGGLSDAIRGADALLAMSQT